MIMEMVLLGFLARNLYKREIPNIENLNAKPDNIISTVFGGTLKKINNNNATDGVENLGYT